jgi:ribokinase
MDAVRLGCAAGSLACLKEGAQPSLPTRQEVERVLTEPAGQ